MDFDDNEQNDDPQQQEGEDGGGGQDFDDLFGGEQGQDVPIYLFFDLFSGRYRQVHE
jgi:hypothetical protein